jgi:tRNA nucleotidyltransferase (CCA-adding enzyme)
LTVQELAINGHDLQRVGIAPGPEMGRLLNHLLDQVLDDPSLNTPDQLLDWVQRVTAAQA